MKFHLLILFSFLISIASAQDLAIYDSHPNPGFQLKAGDLFRFQVSVKNTDTVGPPVGFQLYYFWENEKAKPFNTKNEIDNRDVSIPYFISVPALSNDSNTLTVFITSENDTIPENDTIKTRYYIADAYLKNIKVDFLSTGAKDFLAIGGTKLIKFKITNEGIDSFKNGDELQFRILIGDETVFPGGSPIITYEGDDLAQNESGFITQLINIPTIIPLSTQELCYELYWVKFYDEYGFHLDNEDYYKDNTGCFNVNIVKTAIADQENFKINIQQSTEYLQVTGYPNNAKQIFLSASLHDLSGREVAASHTKSNHYQLPIGNQSGIMILRLKTTEGFINHKVFIH